MHSYLNYLSIKLCYCNSVVRCIMLSWWCNSSIVMDANATSQLRNQGLASTDDSPKFQHKEHESVVKAIYTGSEYIATASGDEDVGLVLESTSFYAEQGGQIYDTGSIEWSFGSFTVNNVQVFAGYVLHIGSFTKGSLSVGDKVTCKVDYIRRALIAPNHTCTHMLNFALREVLGDHVDQKCSIVLPEKLRFDFSHGLICVFVSGWISLMGRRTLPENLGGCN